MAFVSLASPVGAMPSRKPPSPGPSPAVSFGRPQSGAVTLSVAEATKLAFAAYGRGDWVEAERLCRAILGTQPGALPVMNVLGIIAAQSGRTQEAADLFSRVSAAAPADAAAHCNLGNVLRMLDRQTDALDCYERALRLKPDYADAWNNRGAVLRDLGRHGEALESYDRAIGLQPAHAEAHCNRGSALRSLGRRAEAIDSYGRALEVRPEYVDAWNGRGVVFRDLGRLEEALECHDRAIACRPGDTDSHGHRGNALRDLGRYREALESYDRGMALRPGDPVIHGNRSVVLNDLDRHVEALESCDRAVALDPAYVDAWSNRGRSLRHLGRHQEALGSFERAIALRPGDPELHHSRGVVLRELGRRPEALECHDKAIALDPDYVDAHNSRGAVLNELGRHAQALESCTRAIAIDPGCADAHHNRGNALRDLRRYPEAIESYERALELEPGYEWLYGTWLHTRMQICDWREFGMHSARLNEAIGRHERAAPPFAVLALPGSPSVQRTAAETWVQANHPESRVLPPIGRRPRRERLRVAYVSADFREHPVSRAIVELLERHDKSRFELTALSLGPESDDALRRRVAAAFDRWVDVHSVPDEGVARLARELEIDIAVDLGGFTQGCRTNIFAMRAAPLQVSYIGYLGTMGAPYIDYLVADGTIVPAEHRSHYSEKIAYLPSYQANDSRRVMSDRVFDREELGLPRTGFVFGCFNNNYKITPCTFDSWMRILGRVQGSVLFLYAENDIAAANLRSAASARGIDGNRLVFGERLPVEQYLARYRAVDLFLDTLPYNAGVTASDALWAGVPVVTLPGSTFAGRVGASLLSAIGLPELIAGTQEEYEAMAVDLATNPGKSSATRQKLDGNRLEKPLFDARLFTRHLETAYTMMYERYQSGLPPEHIHVEK